MKHEKGRCEDIHKEVMDQSSSHSSLITGGIDKLGHMMLCCHDALETVSSSELHFFHIIPGIRERNSAPGVSCC